MTRAWLGEIRRATEERDPFRALHEVAERMRDAGESQPLVQRAFEDVLAEVASAGKEEPLEALEDVMDRIVGWCALDARIFR